ncbi:hypothetical protein PsYK624_149900 [Phanerochaete sordida]|uniref:Uncharacterized protein n=1 Tax=Phanerochaete sordida TaxID=48140 RepID=A0A9P3LLJ3_9APHY|nr:hypothetical protein PsYK624_149900 [Phanerochaete sordida]
MSDIYENGPHPEPRSLEAMQTSNWRGVQRVIGAVISEYETRLPRTARRSRTSYHALKLGEDHGVEPAAQCHICNDRREVTGGASSFCCRQHDVQACDKASSGLKMVKLSCCLERVRSVRCDEVARADEHLRRRWGPGQ